MEYKGSTTEAKFPETTQAMAAKAPVAIGTRGTVGSLVRREIEYFSKVELDRRGRSTKPPPAKLVDMPSRNCSCSSRPSFWFLMTSWRRKKQRGGKGFISSIFSAAEVVESNRLHGTPGFNYRSLKDDMNNFGI